MYIIYIYIYISYENYSTGIKIGNAVDMHISLPLFSKLLILPLLQGENVLSNATVRVRKVRQWLKINVQLSKDLGSLINFKFGNLEIC